jgi:UDP-2,3-diacylglucosamine hydrolase
MSEERTTFFVSDLHLSEDRPQLLALFQRFMRKATEKADAIYVLGDLFDVWVGDDAMGSPLAQHVVGAFSAASRAGVKTYIMHGNRDFLIGREFCDAARIELLRDPTMVEIQGRRYLLMHGDTLCTKDLTYQGFRRMVRSEKWQEEFLAKPLNDRELLAQHMRGQSENAKSGKSQNVMDAVSETIDAVLRKTGFPDLIHGHTHRPSRHVHTVDGHPCTRWVLPDWHSVGGYLAISGVSIKMRRIEFDQSVTVARG